MGKLFICYSSYMPARPGQVQFPSENPTLDPIIFTVTEFSPSNVWGSVSKSPAWTSILSPVQNLHIALLITCGGYNVCGNTEYIHILKLHKQLSVICCGSTPHTSSRRFVWLVGIVNSYDFEICWENLLLIKQNKKPM